ncbi:hypothetical protein SLEP1_g45826 [Rubroshorea leprosula]|uniref:YTH domain-containing family protein n=1 Tax=Rubroshorea leprosula TaxID=152421 RepID=A0AAV5LK95_9ROSI|nr:hypothetical protein SLEP1_g45826 [Rubroshorea leprosula]
MKNPKVDPSMELPVPNMVPTKDGSPSDATSCISSADATGYGKESDVENESLAMDQAPPYPTEGYYGYYYPGYTDQGYYMGGDGLELQYPVMQADNGSLVYFMPGIQTGYGPYAPYVPVATVGADGQFVTGQLPYSPSSMLQPVVAPPGYIQTPLPYGELVPAPYVWDPSIFVGDGTFGQSYYGIPEIHGSKPNISSPSHAHSPFSKNLPRSDLSNPLDVKSSLPSSDCQGKRNQLKTSSKISHGSTFESDSLGKGYCPFMKYPLHNQGKGGVLYPTNPVSWKANGRGWGAEEKLKPRRKVNSIGDLSLLNEQNQGLRTASVKGLAGGNAAGSFASKESRKSSGATSLIRRDQYNVPDFPTKYDHAFFFVIKSYSEDDIHKSIKYNVWASTPSGNKRLDSAYQDAKQKTAEKGSKCPVFLFFSVNTSGQFCGVAEMMGRVDFNKNMDFWQQDKWSGYFPVKWHIVKDVPNAQLRHIILENNENKPVTNSRDTQEVRFPQGIEMLNIFKNYESKTSILDDFYFYEGRQKEMQEKKARPSISHFNPIKKVEELTGDFQSVDLSASKGVGEGKIKSQSKGMKD